MRANHIRMFKYFHHKHINENIFTFAFYNLDNLFDVFDDPDTLDDDFTPQGSKRWTYRRYRNKIAKMSKIISGLGRDYSPVPPVIAGLAELENEEVLKDLIFHKNLASYHYDYAHYDSPDERGVDVALIFQKEHFELLDSRPHTVYIYNENNQRDYTRDILCVRGRLHGELWHFIVNHWPSRRHGTSDTEHKRLKAAEVVNDIIEEILCRNPDTRIGIMGDFNDEPYDKSVQSIIKSNEQLFNPMQTLKDKGLGTTNHKDRWYLFDQFIFSKNFLPPMAEKHSFRYVDIYRNEENSIWKGKKKNQPFRTYIGRKYTGGHSDHFPIVTYLEKNMP